ncbi:MAG: cation diffusion facilitator family transporter [Campylobacter sp.]|nr:cation diffusion facilitator family transporter [Campylobacter sp.]
MAKKAPIIAGSIAFILAIFKFTVGFFSGSVAVLASAIDSLLDSFISALNFFAIRKAEAAPTGKFNYGFGKIEGLMALFEGVFISCIGLFLIVQSIDKFLNPTSEANFDLAIIIMIISLFATLFIMIYLKKALAKTKSLIIEADLLHYKSDFITNLGIIISLVIIKITGLLVIDSIIGLLIGGYIIYSAFKLIAQGITNLLDKAIKIDIIKQIESYINSKSDILSFHDLKSRKSANICFMSFHLVFPSNISLLKAHAIGDEIEAYIKSEFSDYKWDIEIHFDPFDDSNPTKICYN